MATSFDAQRYVRDLEAAFNARDPTAMARNYAANIEFSNPITSEPVRGFDAWTELARAWFGAFSDVEMRLVHSTLTGSRASILFDMSARQTGEFAIAPGETIPPTNRPVSLRIGEFLDLDDAGKVAKDFVLMDGAKLLQQLGLAPAPGAAAPTGKKAPTR